MSSISSIEEFYKIHTLDKDFDEIIYQNKYPETKDFYQPHCKDNNIDDKHRLFYHYYHYGRNIRGLISDKHKFIFLWTPKAGCTSAKHIFYEHEGIISKERRTFAVNNSFPQKFGYQKRLGEYDQKLINYLTIQIARDPYQRSVSSFFTFKMHQLNPKLGDCPLKDCDFNTYLQLLQNQSIKLCRHCWNHSLPQFMTEKVDEIIKLENIESELIRINEKYGFKFKNIIYDDHSFKKRPIIIQNYDTDYENHLTQENLHLINQIYQKDIEFFKYN